jgi:cellulose synthase/poly-beta-1,6-N-acetylglucosamine synthase-like glycosyltransferase
MELALVITYFGLLSLVSIYGAHRLWMAWLCSRHREDPSRPTRPLAEPPTVLVQLPVYNERYVAERLIRSAASMRHPREQLRIQVLDDSNDDTVEVVARVVSELRAEGIDVRHVRRDERVGFKAGALAHGLTQCDGEFIAVFDADFIPEPDFLENTLPHFADPGVGMVQVRWEHVNRDYSGLTQAQAVLLDGHFVIEHTARYRSGRFFNFNGTAGIWRRATIEDAGGWQHDTLTEDLDLSYRAQQRGWRFVFERDVSVPAELPVDLAAFKSQQHRWAKGSVQTAKKLLLDLLKSDLPQKVKVEAFFHLTANSAYVMMLLLSIMMPLVLMVRVDRGWLGTLAMDLPLFVFATLSVVNFYALSQRQLGRGLVAQLKYIPHVLALGVGMTLNNTRAVVEALVGHPSEFQRTPKYDIRKTGQSWQANRYVRTKWLQPLAEVALGLWMTPGVVVALETGGRALAALPFLILFQTGFLYVGIASLAQAFGVSRARRARQAS